ALWQLPNMVLFSTVLKTGFKELKTKLLEVTQIESLNIDEAKFLGNQRQTDRMKKAYTALKQALKACELKVDVDLIELDIKSCFDELGAITGQAYQDELITALFSKFCLGK
ncbi:MAG: hypothetical protein K2O05_01505, partial [Anaeroplasmataceae bacterium]|nr:hypothetical protein [Anaeroplasmataceae bacterium]